MTSPELDPVDRLLLDDAGALPERILVADAPALAAHLADDHDVTAWADDWAEHQSLPEQVRAASHPILSSGADDLSADLTLYRLPKSLGELDEVAGISARSGAWLIAGARIKHMNMSMNSVIGRHYDAVSASLGVQKSRVLRGIGPHPHDSEWPKKRQHPDLRLWVAAHGGTFAGTKVDDGTRLLIDHLKRVEGDRVVDLGSGNGVLAALLARAGRDVRATDSSAAAVAATRETARLNRLTIPTTWADGLATIDEASADAIVCNPPFHTDRAKDSGPAIAMFADAGRALVPGGEFWCVFNSHLPWKRELTRLIGPTQHIAQNRHYTLTKSTAR